MLEKALHAQAQGKFLARGCERSVAPGHYREKLPRVISLSNSRTHPLGCLNKNK